MCQACDLVAQYPGEDLILLGYVMGYEDKATKMEHGSTPHHDDFCDKCLARLEEVIRARITTLNGPQLRVIK